MNFSEVLERLIAGQHLGEADAFGAMQAILAGEVPPARIAAFLTALRAKGETAGEIAGFVRAMRESMTPVAAPAPVVLDTCGTGGDSKGTFNISTAAAFVASGAGAVVAKHGNRSVSSRCGSADVLEAAGVRIDMPHSAAQRCLEEHGITFLLAPLYHPAMKHVAPVRKELGLRTVFNFLGPLANPARANAQVVGVPRAELLPLLSGIFKQLNHGKPGCALVVHEAGYDEIVLLGKGKGIEIVRGAAKARSFAPKDFGFRKAVPEHLNGGDAAFNAGLLRQLLSGAEHPLRPVVLANAALALQCADRAAAKPERQPLSLGEAVARAKESLDSGRALKKLEALIEGSRKP